MLCVPDSNNQCAHMLRTQGVAVGAVRDHYRYDLSGLNRAMPPRCTMRLNRISVYSLAIRKSFFASDAKEFIR